MCGDLSATQAMSNTGSSNSSDEQTDSRNEDVHEKSSASKNVGNGSVVDIDAVYQDLCLHGF